MLPPVVANYIPIICGYAIYLCTPFLNEAILFVLQLFGINRYLILGDKEHYKGLIKKIEQSTRCSSYLYRTGKITPTGYFIGPNFMGYFDRESRYIDEERVILYATQQTYSELVNKEDVELVTADLSQSTSDEEDLLLVPKKDPTKSKIKKYIRTGCYKSFYYTHLTLDVTTINPIGDQIPIIDDILRIYKKKSRVVAFIHGITRAGKSSIGHLIAKSIKGKYCNSFNPSEPGDSFANMLDEINDRDREEDQIPLVVVLEEANCLIKTIHDQSAQIHLDIPTPVKDKRTWCGFLDDMVLYKNIVLILTSNESKDNIDKLDPAYLGKGRIDATYSMMNQLAIPDS